MKLKELPISIDINLVEVMPEIGGGRSIQAHMSTLLGNIQFMINDSLYALINRI
jgi:hypothetical protein